MIVFWFQELTLVAGLGFAAIAFAHLAGLRIGRRGVAAVTACGVALAVGRQVVREGLDLIGKAWVHGWDFQAFRRVGANLLAGRPAVAGIPGMVPLNPPTADPLFAAFALVPEPVGESLWMFASLALALALVPAAAAVLRDQAEPGEAVPDRPARALLTAAFVTGLSVLWGLDAGQLGTLIPALILLALWARARGRPVVAGLALGLATMKPTTMLPFLLLFARRRDAAPLGVLGATVVGLTLLFNTPAGLPGRLAEQLDRIDRYGQPGALNDPAPTALFSQDIVGLDHLMTRLGPIGPGPARRLALVALAASGLWLAWTVLGARRPRGACVAMVSIYAMIFLYHRAYDAPILAFPLVYAAGQVAATTGRRRGAYLAASGLLLMVLHLQPFTLLTGLTYATVEGAQPRVRLSSTPLWRSAAEATVGRFPAIAPVVRAVILPYADWALLGAFGLIALASRRDRPTAGSGGDPRPSATNRARGRPGRAGDDGSSDSPEASPGARRPPVDLK